MDQPLDGTSPLLRNVAAWFDDGSCRRLIVRSALLLSHPCLHFFLGSADGSKRVERVHRFQENAALF